MNDVCPNSMTLAFFRTPSQTTIVYPILFLILVRLVFCCYGLCVKAQSRSLLHVVFQLLSVSQRIVLKLPLNFDILS